MFGTFELVEAEGKKIKKEKKNGGRYGFFLSFLLMAAWCMNVNKLSS
jgi:hypothetical protein